MTFDSNNSRSYSPFWVCLVVFSSLLLANIVQLYSLYQQRQGLHMQKQMMAQNWVKVQPKAQQAEAFLDGLARDLVELSKTNKTAAQITSKYNIKVNDKKEDSGN